MPSSATLCFLSAAVLGLSRLRDVEARYSTNFTDQGARNISSGRGWNAGVVNYRSPAYASSPALSLVPDKDCPPCFNCRLPAFTCGQYGKCDDYDGQCKCPPGWGGIDCLEPQCDSLIEKHRYLRPDGEDCRCSEGWGGINCNVCKTDAACKNAPIPGVPDGTIDDADRNMTCYKGGVSVFSNHQICDVTNRKILDMLPDRPPKVTFSCDKQDGKCSFQFWAGRVESFYCGLSNCTSELKVGYDTNTTTYKCEEIQCSCIPGRFICGEDGSLNIDDFLREMIKGPASFSCKTGQSCTFEEPGMNSLIEMFFGDSSIFLKCDSGECLHYSQVPGYVTPPRPDHTKLVALSTAGAILIVVAVSALLWYAGRDHTHFLGQIRLPGEDASKIIHDHPPRSLHFKNISYALGARTLLDNISGSVQPGQILAIMGASGAGKTTFLDILARRRKRGTVSGTILVNGKEISDSEFKRIVGFVDQEDTLMSTLTVYETVLYSALLRLPREMSLEAKKYRTLETLEELGILGIRDSRIGDSSNRSISGGEKRRVSIACEMVTSPSILFLDEPTSGLDAYNAFNVVDCLVNLAKNFKRTVVFTIHQPRSNIVALFDQLLLLAQGKLVYSGEVARCHEYLSDIGQACPPGFNLADFLIDMTTQASKDQSSGENTQPPSRDDHANYNDEERALHPGISRATNSLRGNVGQDGSTSTAAETAQDETELQTRSTTSPTDASFVKRKTSELFEAIGRAGSGGASQRTSPALTPRLASLVEAYAVSDVAKTVLEGIEEAQRRGRVGGQLDMDEQDRNHRSRRGASWPTQFRILSGRAFKNLYRDPALLTTHYLSSIGLAMICGFFYRNVQNDIAGFQNRLGVFFFTLALFGFSCLSVIGLFANERLLFMRERANGYYSSFTYFASKILFDILPLRVVPPLVFGAIVYPLVGLVPEVTTFWKFLLILVLFNLATASAVLLISVSFASTGVANLVGTLVMLYNLLFTGLLINRSSLGHLEFLTTLSFFHAAFEALAVNELRYLQLKEVKFGVELDVPAAAILSTFGLRAQSFWWPNTALLGIFFGLFTTAAWVVLHYHVRERR